MRWLESQIDLRGRYDKEMTEQAYAELAASVSRPQDAPRYHADDLEQAEGAVRVCLRHCGVVPGEVPDSVTDIEERIDWLCRPSGTMRREVRLTKGWHHHAFGAMLGRLDTGEPVALLPRGVRGYGYMDLTTHRSIRVTNRNIERFQEQAILFYRPLPARPLKIRDLARFIFGVFDINDYLLVILAAAVVTFLGLIPAAVYNIAYGTVMPSGRANLVVPLAALLLGVSLSTVLFGACRNIVMARVSTKLEVVSEAAVYARMMMLPPSFFKQYSSGNLGSRVAEITMLVQNITSILLGSGLSTLLALVYIFQIGAYAPALALPALLIALVEAGLTVLATLISVNYEHETIQASVALSGTVTALLNGIQKIKLAGAEDRAFAKWAHGYAKYANYAYNRPAIMRALPALVTVVGLLGGIAIYYLAASTGVSVKDYMSFNVAYGQITAAIMALAGIAGQIAQIGPTLKIVEPILEAVPEVSQEKPSVEEISGAIEVLGLSFRYSKNSPYIVEDLSFRIHDGEYVALVGKSGCGKSTIMRLLLGFETPERGSILYGSLDIQKVDLRSLRRKIGTVMQDGKLFMGDIQSNITIASPTATLDDAWAAAEIAGIADDIRAMPMGMQTIISEGGGGVSGGQRQRLMIARAVCGNRRILMFDEATSALDNVTQKHVADALGELKCTRLVVAHRLSTVRHCDRILVLDEGKIVEEGSFEELIDRGGLFAELVRRQRLDKDV